MNSVLFLSDVVLDPVVKEIKQLSGDRLSIDAYYEEDLISKLLTLGEEELKKYALVFVHSDQIFHKKDQSWQRSYLQTISAISNQFSKNIVVSNACTHSFNAAPLKLSFGSNYETIKAYSDEIGTLLNHANIYIFDFLSVCMTTGVQNMYNYNLGHLYQMPYTKPAIKAIATEFVNQATFLFAEEKKVIVLDCDNTLWKGVVGEDGIEGISCDKNADGILYYHLQQFLKAKKEEGFLLCLCSKNNEADVKEVFDKKNLPLHWSDFIVTRINWEDKVNNIISIGKDLNVGVDSFIFLDDNLFELNSIKELLAGVACIHITGIYTELLANLNSFLFRKKQILKSDQEKTEQYELEKLRKSSEQAFANLDEFIASLNINLDIRLNDTADYPRLSQMTGKVNQFNINKHAYNEAELAAFSEGGRIYSLKVSDKYGDYGTVGLIMVKIDDKTAVMENYLISCRALGKKIEYNFYDHVVTDLSSQGIVIKEIRFIANDKNQPAQTFLKSINYGS